MVKGLLTLLLAADTKGFNIKMDAAAKRMKRVRQATALAKGALIAFGAAAAIALGADAIRSIIRFDKSMVGLSAILGVTRKQMKALEKQAIDLGGATIFTAVQIGELQTVLARFGFSQSEIEASTKGITDLAAAAGIDLAQAADTGAATLRAFGLAASEMPHVADVMTNAFTKSALSVDTFADAMTYAAPIAASTGVTLEETAAALAILADNGIRGSIAGTGLRRILVALGGEGKTISAIMKEAAIGMQQTGDATKYAKDQVGLFAIAPFLTLARNADKISGLTEEMDEFGTASKVSVQQLTSIANKIKLVDSAWKGFIFSVETGEGTLGRVLAATLDGITKVLNRMSGKRGSSSSGYSLTENELIAIRKAGQSIEQLDFSNLKDGGVEFSGFSEEVKLTADQMAELNTHFEEYLRLVEGNMEGAARTADTFAKNVQEQTAFLNKILGYSEAIDKVNEEAEEKRLKEQERLKKAFATQEAKKRAEIFSTIIVYDAVLDRYREMEYAINRMADGLVKMKKASEGLSQASSLIPSEGDSAPVNPVELFKEIDGEVVGTEYYDDWVKNNERVIESYTRLGATIGNVFANAGRDMENFGTTAVAQLADIAVAYAATAAIAAVTAAAQTSTSAGPFALYVLPAMIGIAAGLVRMGLSAATSQPRPFAEGGIVSGTTYGMLGEYASAGRDPEVVAPLSKLSGMLDQGSGTRVFGEFVLRGRTLVAAVNTENNRQNKYGG